MSLNKKQKSFIDALSQTSSRTAKNKMITEFIKSPIKELESLIVKANDVYYNTGKPILDDADYDILIDLFKEHWPKNAILQQIGAPIRSEIVKEKLPFWMGSMDKVKPNSKPLNNWLDKYSPPYLISEKLDGLSALLCYKISSKDKSINLYTRGNGEMGQNISHLIPILKLNTKEIISKLSSLNKLNNISKICIRGELMMKKSTFERKYKDKYPKIRSLVAGNINAKKPDVETIHDIEFVGYEVILNNGEKKDSLPFDDQFILMKQMGFNCVGYEKVASKLSSDVLMKYLLDMKTTSKYEIDGIILTDNNVNVRNTKGNPKYAVAFKRQLDEQMADTTVLNVEWNASKHGALIPRIKLKPIKIGGDTIQYTTGFNAKYIVDNVIGVGSKLTIIRSGDVIPYILKVNSQSTNKKPLMPPNKKDTYGEWKWSTTKKVDIILVNLEENKEVKIKELANFFIILKVVGVSEGMITRLVESGFDTIKRICLMSIDDFLTIHGVKETMANKLFDNIHTVIDKDIPLSRLMAATNLFKGGLGHKKLEIVVSCIKNIMEPSVYNKLTVKKISECEGFSDKTSKAFIEGFEKFIAFLKGHPFLKWKTSKLNKKVSRKQENSKIQNLHIVLTGFRDSTLEELITSYGGKLQSSINSKTKLVVAKDTNANSSKIKKAHELNIKLISLEAFNKTYL